MTNGEIPALVTVIIPTFNRRTWIEECLDSVLAQTYPHIETIVVDDRSTDDTVEWLKEQPKYAKVKLHVQEQNGGASVARNTAIEMAEGDLLVFIDSDDKLLPTHVETAVQMFHDHPDLGLFCCDSKMIDSEGRIIADGRTWHQMLGEAKGLDVRTGFRTLPDVFAYSNCFPGFTLRKAVFEQLGMFDQSIFPADDYDLALRVAGSDYKVFYLHEALCLRREHDGQCSGIQNSVKTQLKLIEALEAAVRRNPITLGKGAVARRRLADIEMELGICMLKEGDKASGIRTLLGSVLSRPSQIGKLTKLGVRRFSKR